MSESETKSAAQIAREKRQARIKQSAAERMARITSNVRPKDFDDGVTTAKENVAPDAASTETASVATPVSTKAVATAASSDDPPEVDISLDSHSHHLPTARNREDPFGSLTMPPGSGDDDPFAAMLQQMLGQGGPEGAANPFGGPGGPGGPGGAEPDLSQLMSMMMGGGDAAGGMGGMGSMGAGGAPGAPFEMPKQAAAPASPKSIAWTLVHLVTASVIGLYTVVTYAGKGVHLSSYFSSFYNVKPLTLFVTAELVLQTARLVQDKGRLPADSMLLQLAAFVPQPYRGYIESGSRVYKTFRLALSDFCMVMFILGLSTLLQS